jgi:hypothetical protein
VIDPAKTGNDSNNRIAVMKIDQMNNGTEFKDNDEERILIIVVIKLMAPKIEDIPAICKLKIAKSTEIPE